MKEITIFKNEKFGEVRTQEVNGQILFCGNDVAKALGYSIPKDAVKQHCRGVVKHLLMDSLGREQVTNFIPESDLYRLIAKSQLESAIEFEKWVFEEVLPSIRKHGGYLTASTLEAALLSPETLIRLATDLKTVREQREKLQLQMAEEKPYTDFGKIINDTPASILIGDYAKLITRENFCIGRNRLFEWFLENKYLYRDARKNIRPYQQYVEKGLFEVKENSITNSKGSIISITTKITGSGQIYFLNKILPPVAGE